jgi:hypothetical protein
MNRGLSLSMLAVTSLAGGVLYAADPPSAEITNGQIKAKVCLPDQQNGFYHSTRFDWSGIVCHMEYKGHVFYTPWWYKLDLQTYDFGYDDTGVRHPPRSGWLDELGRLKGGWPIGSRRRALRA